MYKGLSESRGVGEGREDGVSVWCTRCGTNRYQRESRDQTHLLLPSPLLADKCHIQHFAVHPSPGSIPIIDH